MTRPRKTHGRSGTPEYRAWQDALQRCNNPKNAHFKDYGARGISVCAEWSSSFDAFFSHLGPRPAGTTLDRQDNSLGYQPGNCRWATPLQQVHNTRVKRTNAFGVSGVSWHAAAQKFRVSIRAAGRRFYLGLSPDFFEACCIRKSAENRFHTNH